jgi:phage shock protein E
MARLRLLTMIALAAVTGCSGGAAHDDYGDALFVDVRTPEEYAAGHVTGSLLIPVDEIEARLAEPEPHRERRIVLYCRTGRRSGIALDVLQRHGFGQVENAGAFTRLRDAGVPTSSGMPAAAPRGMETGMEPAPCAGSMPVDCPEFVPTCVKPVPMQDAGASRSR